MRPETRCTALVCTWKDLRLRPGILGQGGLEHGWLISIEYPCAMCGRFTLHATSQELADGTACRMLAGFREERRYNIAPGQWVIVVRPEKGEREPTLAQWGLLPSWAKDPAGGPRPINARAEGLDTKPTFRGALRHGRCLIPASGFYDWKGQGKGKQPFYIRPREGKGIFVFAGLMSTWAGPEGELTTCTIITTTPNTLMAAIHDRMPVILSLEGQVAWLDPENQHPMSVLVPCAPASMEVYPVGSAVGNPRHDGPELIQPLESAGD